ncbi:Putative ribonuclease H protein At1g65750 [Linum perenne]
MISFWFDHWARGVRLVSAYPRIAAAAQSRDTLFSDVCYFSDSWNWSIPLRYQLRGGALAEWNSLLTFLNELPRSTLTEGPPSIHWPLQTNGLFSVASLRRALGDIRFSGFPNFPSNVIWISFIPSKITSFCWKVYHKKIATIDNLQRRGFYLANRCVLCLNSSESVEHLFLHCSFVSTIWSLLSSRLSFHGPFHGDMKGFILAWKGMNCVSGFDPAMKTIMHAVFWFIWKERNDRIFKDSSSSCQALLFKLWFTVGDWLRVANRFTVSQHQLWRRLVFDNG